MASIGFLDFDVVGAHITPCHQPGFIECPMLVAMGSEPLTAGIAPFVFEPDTDAIGCKCPEFFHELIIEFVAPLIRKERLDGIASDEKLITISPL